MLIEQIDVRQLEREIGKVGRKLARQIAEDGTPEVVVTHQMVDDLLGRPKVHPEKAAREDAIGVSTGGPNALAALIPASRRERELLGPVAGRIKERAGDAVNAARDAGQARLDELGLTRDKGTETLRTILEGAGDAAKASAEAAVANIRGDGASR